MKKYLLTLTIFLTLIPLLIGSYIMIGPGGIYTSVDREKDTIILIEKGMGISQMADLLITANLINHKYTFYGATALSDQWGKLKAGEYIIPNQARPIDIVGILASGRGIIHSLTIPEGLTVHEITEIIQETPLLKGIISKIPSEGYLLPETYRYVYGDTKQGLIDRMEADMKTNLARIWSQNKANLPYGSVHEMLIMASIIEKETGHSSERARVAAVFVNRLKLGMKLQADPTVIYGITLGRQKLGRLLNRNDLQSETAYNTYVIAGLPPHPIACPGKASLEAAMNPLDTRDLYFVADGQGSHNFSDSLTQHNAYVRQWRGR